MTISYNKRCFSDNKLILVLNTYFYNLTWCKNEVALTSYFLLILPGKHFFYIWGKSRVLNVNSSKILSGTDPFLAC